MNFSHAKHGAAQKLGCPECHQVRAGLPQAGRSLLHRRPITMLRSARKAVCRATMARGHLGETTFLFAVGVTRGRLGVSKWHESIYDIYPGVNDKAASRIGIVHLVGGFYEDTNCVSRNTTVDHADRVNFQRSHSWFRPRMQRSCLTL